MLIKPKEPGDIVQSVIELKRYYIKDKLIMNAYNKSKFIRKCAKILSDFIYEDNQSDSKNFSNCLCYIL